MNASSRATTLDERTPPVPVICGPTAAGKSAVALALADHAPITIISADSRQIYRGFDIGTAKPTPDERARVPHEGVDVVDPTDRYSAWHWARLARTAITRARAAGRVPVVVGGTGFYLRALTTPLAPVPPLEPARRDALAAWLDRQPPREWQRWCERLDPERAVLGPTQWRRAIEVALLTGTALSAWHAKAAADDVPTGDTPDRPLRVRYLVVDPGASLAERIAARVQRMLADGWLDEVRALHQVVSSGAPAWNATGYDVLRDLLARGAAQHEGERARAIERVIIDTRQYAKRQRTWWRHQLRAGPVTWLDPEATDAPDRVRTWWQQLNEAIQ